MRVDYRQLEAFAAVVECCGFERAAQKLCVTQSAISQRVRQLEDRLGQVLLTRGQPPRPTPAGEHLLMHYRQVRELEGSLLEALFPERLPQWQALTIAVNADSLATWLPAALFPLLQEQNFLVDMRVADQTETQALLRSGEVSGCISESGQPVQGCSVTPLGIMRYRPMAAPGFVARWFPQGLNVDQLRQASAVEFDRSDRLQARYLEHYWALAEGSWPCHRVPSPEQFVGLIADGIAWGMVPELQAAPQLRDGRLQLLEEDHVIDVPLYWHSWRVKAKPLETLGRVLEAAARRTLLPIT